MVLKVTYTIMTSQNRCEKKRCLCPVPFFSAAAAIDTPSADEPPPSYEEVARLRAPQNQYGDSPNQEGYTSPSAPLLAENPTSGYSSIAIPPPRPSSLSPSCECHTFDDYDLLFALRVLLFVILWLMSPVSQQYHSQIQTEHADSTSSGFFFLLSLLCYCSWTMATPRCVLVSWMLLRRQL